MQRNARLSLLAATLVAGIVAFAGGWARRWMSDDGLIVLRTVRNLLAGNGPVFNAGERVEANTSTLWQYLITGAAWVSGGRLEDIATALALTLTVLAAAIATFASGSYWNHALRRATPVIPLGIIIYLALPPARDFATSGLEWGLSIFWLAVWFALLVDWATPARRALPSPGYLLAFWCGLSWLVRPELALYGGITGIVLIAFAPRKTPGILAAALPVPAAYQIFRMGYYGLLTPHTAVAKSAADAQWAQGWGYLRDFVDPYGLYLPVAIAVLIGAVGVAKTRGRLLAVAGLTAACATLHILYILRVGGDFMHGRMLLLPLFALLLPAMAVPFSKAVAAAATVVVAWAAVLVVKPAPAAEINELGIVDERAFWTQVVGPEGAPAPQYAEDFLDSYFMRGYKDALDSALEDDAAQIAFGYESLDPVEVSWFPRERDPELPHTPTTAYWINLGMISMNAPLEARILDTVGLATPLAARMPRDPDERIGHDKHLSNEWQVADTAADLDELPDWFNAKLAKQARKALDSPEISELLATSREPMSWERFKANLKYSLGPGRTLQLDDDPVHYLSR